MSLFVKDMDIPLFNPEDALYTHYPACICVFPDGTANLKILIPQYDGTYRQDPNEYAIENIPAPHGRLIDADKLTKNMRNYYPSIDHLCCSQHVVTKGDIDNAPTVIEAEHESEAQKWARVGRDISKGLQEGIEAINSEEIEE